VPLPGWTVRLLAKPWSHVAVGLIILLLDYLTGPFLLFPILFVIPVSLCAWFYRARLAYWLSVLLPIGRFMIAEFVDQPHPWPYMVLNALIRIAVLLFLAFLVARAAHQARLLAERVSGLVTMCAWSRTIEYQGEWLSFEHYLKRRFNIDTSHGISPAEAERFFEQMKASDQGA
jgi:hypothetical protein